MKIGVAGNKLVAGYVLNCIEDERIQIVPLDCDFKKYIPIVSGFYRRLNYYTALQDVDAVFWCSPETWTARALRTAHKLGKKTIVYWIGTDVLLARKKAITCPDSNLLDLQFACSPRLVEELAAIGQHAELLYTPTDLPESVIPMPEQHAVLLNIPDTRADFYGAGPIKRLIAEHPNIRFIMTRSQDSSRYPFKNVDFRGMLDREGMDQAFSDASIVIRYPKHDGMALSIVEAMAKGRDVICNQPVPHTILVETYEELSAALEQLTSKPPAINWAAHNYALKEFSRERCSEELWSYLKTIS